MKYESRTASPRRTEVEAQLAQLAAQLSREGIIEQWSTLGQQVDVELYAAEFAI
jgi:hypothetical protein